MIELLVVLPFLLSGIISLLFKDDAAAGLTALVAGILSIGIVAWLYLHNPGAQAINWFSVGPYSFTLVTTLSGIHLIFLALVALMTTLVILYSLGFMDVASEKRSFYMQLSFFAAGMMLFAVGADLITLFIGWELIGITSYLLIGFWRYKESAVKAAKKAVIVLLIGDMLVFSGIALLWAQSNSVLISYVMANATGTVALMAALLITVGALTKSAQFPFHQWLPDAMEGPTPVSALLHSSTMVKAGVFLVAVLLTFLLGEGMGILLVGAGLASVILAAVNAASTTHIKKILAYSTIQDMGLMFIALGLNALPAAILLFIFQTFYKGLIFMDAGILTKTNNDETDIRKILGIRRPLVLIPVVIAVAALAGIFPLGGFFGKFAVDSAVQNYPLYLMLMLVEVVSSLYIFRWLFVPLSNKLSSKKPAKKTKKAPGYAIPNSMLAAVYILTFAVLASAAVWIYSYGGLAFIPLFGAVAFTAAVLVGLLLAYLLYYRKLGPGIGLRTALSRIFESGGLIDDVYGAVVTAVRGLGAAVALFDYNLYSVAKGAGYGLGGISRTMEKTENGSMNYYLAAFVVGAIVAVIIFSVI
jgi:NADH-quinone oxidoreductase subunit L